MIVEKNSVWLECALAGSAFVNISTIPALVGHFDQDILWKIFKGWSRWTACYTFFVNPRRLTSIYRRRELRILSLRRVFLAYEFER
jgi:hypothetical protein